MNNKMTIEFLSLPQNEGFARTVISAFCLDLSPTIEELSDIKTAVSEAVTNCVVHAYDKKIGIIKMSAAIDDGSLFVEITDFGKGIDDIEKAKEPFFTTKPYEERSGMGFTVMESFMDDIAVLKNEGSGIIVRMTKKIKSNKSVQNQNSGGKNALSRPNN